MTVHVENADATEQTSAIQRVHGAVGKAQHAKIKCKAEPESMAFSEAYINAVKAAHSALEDAGALLTKLASRAIEQAVETCVPVVQHSDAAHRPHAHAPPPTVVATGWTRRSRSCTGSRLA